MRVFRLGGTYCTRNKVRGGRRGQFYGKKIRRKNVRWWTNWDHTGTRSAQYRTTGSRDGVTDQNRFREDDAPWHAVH